jgi:hypothetical protein
VVHLSRQAQLLDRGHGISAAHDRQALGPSQGSAHAPGPLAKGLKFKDSHGAIPNHGAGLGHLPGESSLGDGPDVQAHAPVGNFDTANLGQRISAKVICYPMIHGQAKLHSPFLRLFEGRSTGI